MTAITSSPAKTRGTRKLEEAVSIRWPMPALPAHGFRNHGADESQGHRDLQRGEEVGHRAGDPHLQQDVDLACPEGAQHVAQLRLQGRQAGGDVHHDGKEGDGEGGEDGRDGADAEPHTTRTGTMATLGMLLKPTSIG